MATLIGLNFSSMSIRLYFLLQSNISSSNIAIASRVAIRYGSVNLVLILAIVAGNEGMLMGEYGILIIGFGDAPGRVGNPIDILA